MGVALDLMSQRRRFFLVSGIIPSALLGALYMLGYFSFLLWVVLFLSVLLCIYTLDSTYVFPEQLFFGIYFLVINVTLLGGMSLFDTYITPISSFSFDLVALYVVSVLVLYASFLMTNIYNVATVKTVPILKVAQSTYTGFVLVLNLLWAAYVVYEVGDLASLVWGWTLYSVLVSLAYFYLNQIKVVESFQGFVKIPFVESGVVGLLQTSSVVMLIFWDTQSLVRWVFLASSLTLHLVLMKNKMQRTVNQKGLRDFSLLLLAVYGVILVNGLLGF